MSWFAIILKFFPGRNLLTLQMPGGIPEVTVALNGAKNAGLLAARVFSEKYKTVRDRIRNYLEEMKDAVMEKV